MSTNSSILSDVLLVCIAGLILAHTISLHRRQRLFFLDPLYAFWAGVLIIYVGQPICYRTTFIVWHGEETFEATLAWTLLGLLCVVLGYESKWGPRAGAKIPQAPARLAPAKLMLAGWGLIALGLIGYAYLFDSAGGMRDWLAVARGGTDYDNVSAYLAGLADLLPLGVLLLLFQAHFHDEPVPQCVLVWILFALVWWWFLYLGSRSKLIGFTVGAMAAYYLPARKSPSLALAGLVFVALIVLSNFQGAYRDRFTDLSLHLDEIDAQEAAGNVLPIVLGGDSGQQSDFIVNGIEFNCVMAVIGLVPDKVPYNYGYGYLELFTRWIPHSVWPDKIYPQMEAVQGVLREGELSLANVRNSDMLMGPAFTFVGHWYYVGGPIGLMIGGLFTGVMFRTIRTIYDRGSKSQGDIVIYASLIGIGFSEAASTPLAWVTTLPFALGPLALVLYWARIVPVRWLPRVARPWDAIHPTALPRP